MFLFAGQYPNFLWLYKEILMEIKQQLIFKTDIQNYVNHYLDDLKSVIKGDKEILFIGVHCRRTDMEAAFQVREPLCNLDSE